MECEYKEHERLLTEQFICGLNKNGVIDEILRKVVTLEKFEDAMNEHVLIWACSVKTQKAQKAALNDIREAWNLMLLGTVHRSMIMGHLECRKSGKIQVLWYRANAEAMACIW